MASHFINYLSINVSKHKVTMTTSFIPYVPEYIGEIPSVMPSLS